MIFYSESTQPIDFRVDITKINATKKSLEHYSNYIILTKMLSCGKYVAETVQINKELTICERKINYWKRQYNFSQNDFERGCLELKQLWSK